MQTVGELPAGTHTPDEPASEHTEIRPTVGTRTIPVEQLRFQLFVPHRTHDPMLESAYQVWRDVWQQTWQEAQVATQVYSDEFTRQDEIGVLSLGADCLSVTCMRWLDLSRARSLEDSYFKHWPEEAVARIAGRFVCVGSNTAVHPSWRRALIQPPHDQAGDPVRLAFAAIALTVQRFVSSSADSLVALTRNDRSIDRILVALGSTTLARIKICGNDTDVICVERHTATPEGSVINDLWRRRHQA